LEVETI
jgi:hypothetical protein